MRSALRLLVSLTACLGLVGVTAPPVAAADAPPPQYTFVVRLAQRDCNDRSAVLRVRAAQKQVTQHGVGRIYYLKGKIQWQSNIGTDRWRTDDHRTMESGHYLIRNPHYELFLPLADRTVWGNAYDRLWRAKVTVWLKRERTGPDATVWKQERWFYKNRFNEVSSGGLLCYPDVGGI